MVAHLAFEVLGLHRLGSYSNPANERSTRALLGVGFRHEGVLRHWHRHGDRHLDVNVFGMLRDEWAAGPWPASPVTSRASRRPPSGPAALPAEPAHGEHRAHGRPDRDHRQVAQMVDDAGPSTIAPERPSMTCVSGSAWAMSRRNCGASSTS